jgi:prepilin-type N-terminal cleavage/methylation domain-containing protein
VGARPLRPLRAFTLLELLIVIGIIAVLVSILLVVMTRARASANRAYCLSNLRQIGLAFSQYTNDSRGRFPDPADSNLSWESSLEPYLHSTRAFCCPTDQEVFSLFGSSYDWRDTGQPETTRAARFVTDPTRSDIILAYESLPGWHAKNQINLVRLDGSAQSVDYEQCLADLATPIQSGTHSPSTKR